MKKLRSLARFLGTAFVVNLQAVAEYRINFLVQFLGMMLNNAAFAVFWAVLIARTGGIGGYGLPDIMFVWALVSSSFGLAHVVFGNVRNLGEIVVKGELDVYLLQPRDPWLNLLCSKTIVSAWGDFAYGFIVLAFLPGLGSGRIIMFCILTVTGSLLFAAAFSAVECLSFFIGNAGTLGGALSEFILTFTLYPNTVFDPGMRWIFYTIFPSAFIAFIPLDAWKRLDWSLVPLLFLVAALYVALSYALFRLGLRRYESGNQMGMRL